MRAKVRAGIVGMGDGGMLNYHGLKAAGMRVSAFCDTDLNRLKRFKSSRCYLDFRHLVSRGDVDLVVVATPDNLHLAVADAALKAGKHVFVEKPVATTMRDLYSFAELDKEFPGKLLFGENQSYTGHAKAILRHRNELGRFIFGHTFYVMGGCNRIMGGGKWRTECAYNPVAGGGSHNLMVARLAAGCPIVRVRATGRVVRYHENLDSYGGYDTMEGTVEFENGAVLQCQVCIAIESFDTLFGMRDMAHFFQFEHGALSYAPLPDGDRLVVNGRQLAFKKDPLSTRNEKHFLGLYRRMHEDTLRAMRGGSSRHTILHGINVAAACVLAFDSAKTGGKWLDIPQNLIF